MCTPYLTPEHLKSEVKQCQVLGASLDRGDGARTDNAAWDVDLPYMHFGILTPLSAYVRLKIPSSGAISKFCFLHLFSETRK